MKIKKEVREILYTLMRVDHMNGYVKLSGKKCHIGKMSYDEYFIEKYKPNRKETDKFDDDTLWEDSDFEAILQLLIDNNLLDTQIAKWLSKNSFPFTVEEIKKIARKLNEI